jgi:SpoVK/Ycf46/Vps4 family AAA+-type ATPase
MARGDLVLKLVQAGMSGDKSLFERTTRAIISEEKAKDHHILASRIEEKFKNKNKGTSNNKNNTYYLKNKNAKNKALIERIPRFTFEDLILNNKTLNICDELIEEQQKADILRANNVEPRHRVLLVGPPGNGKTSLAEAIAEELMIPLFIVSYEQLISSYLGETAKKIDELFEFVSKRNCVLFFDEFDVLGKERGDSRESGEIKRVVSSLLMQVDDLPSNVVVVTATNHPELLDRAVWRRFQIKLELDYPSKKDIIKWFNKFEKSINTNLKFDKDILADKLFGLSFAEIEQFGLDVYRRLILSGSSLKSIIKERLEQWNNKMNE